jgi:undecaprenyl-diphosphatase
MNGIFQSIILGLAQGLGEFLPISSSGHLVIIPWLFHFSDPGLAFDVALHFGTLLAVLAYFWKDIILIFKLAFKNQSKVQGLKSEGQSELYNSKTLWFLAIATVPGVIFGYFLDDLAETVFRSPLLIAFTLSFAGLILYLADRYAKHKKDLESINWKDSIIIGLSQALAIIPGVSRSGATITAGLAAGLDRVSAARFSFLLSAPIIFGATAFKLPHLLKEGISANILIGVFVSAMSGYLAIKYLIKFIEKTSYSVFFWYRLGLAVLIAIVYFAR